MDESISRRRVLGAAVGVSGAALAASALGMSAAGAETVTGSDPPFPDSPQAALARLMAGNRRFVEDRVRAPRRGTVRKVQVAQGQQPFAAILTCADSRVPPELVFDQGLGDLFVVRVAGNTADPLVVGSLEYAVEVLGTVLVFVLGHSECGAVKAAIETVETGDVPPGDLEAVVAPIVPAIDAVQGTPKDEMLEAATDQNILLTMEQLAGVELLAPRIADGTIEIAGGEYELDTGRVDLVP